MFGRSRSAHDGAAQRLSSHMLAFVLLAGLAAGASRLVVASAGFARDPEILGLALAFDLAVVVPAAYYALLVRGGRVPAITTLPVFVAASLLATAMLPPGDRTAAALALVIFPAEAALAAVLIYRVRQIVRSYRHEAVRFGTFEGAFPRATRTVLGSSRAVELLVAEVLHVYFAFLAWRRRPESSERGSWSSHREPGWSGVFIALSFVVCIEIIAVHLLVSRWSPGAAWGLLGLGVYGLVWLVADYRAMVILRTTLSEDLLRIRIGLRWAVDIPVESIRTARAYGAAPSDTTAPRLVVLGRPGVVLELDRPVEVRGIMGMTRRASTIAIGVDDSDSFQSRVERVRSRADAAVRTQEGGPQPTTTVAQPQSFALPPASVVLDRLARPILDRPARWLTFNCVFLAVMAAAAYSHFLFPGLSSGMVEQLMSSPAAAAIGDRTSGGAHAILLAPLLFLTNFASVMILVVAPSMILPFAGLLAGALLAVPLGFGLGLAVGAAPLTHLVPVAVVVLLEQQAVVLGMAFSWEAGCAFVEARRSGAAGRHAMRRRMAATLGPAAAAIATFLIAAAVCEAAVIMALPGDLP